MQPKTAQERVYLAVPYAEREEAKKLGAKWDTKAKSWFAEDNNQNLDKLRKWLPENITNEQGPAKTVREEFADALRSLGCVVPPGSEHPIMDGKKHRIETEGDKLGAKAGFYVGHTDGHPAGFIQNNKTGQSLKWKSKGYTLSDSEKAKLAAEAANKLAAREAEQKQTHLDTAERLQKQLANLSPLVEPTPYFESKACSVNPGVFTDDKKKTTFIPAYDADGKIWTVQYINEDGTKRFAKDSKKEGCFHVVGGLDKLADAPAIVIGEGYATADSTAKVLGFSTVAAFDSGNLLEVGKTLAAKYPDKPIIFVGDDDRHLKLTQGVNIGREKAEAAAEALGGKAVFPIFSPGEQSYPESVPQITPELYKKHLATVEKGMGIDSGTVLDKSQLSALSKIKGFTDFNDLANKSELGPEAIKRQIKPIVEKAIMEHLTKTKIRSTSQELNRDDKKQRSMKIS
jgi:putative DNA primase/helicase